MVLFVELVLKSKIRLTECKWQWLCIERPPFLLLLLLSAFVGLATNGRLFFGRVGGWAYLGLDRIARAKPVATKTQGKKESTMIFWGNRGSPLTHNTRIQL
jgi:hypothetical protein